MRTNKPRMAVFAGNLRRIMDEAALAKSDLRVLFRLMELAGAGGGAYARQCSIARDLGMDKGNLSRIMKRLKEAALIVEMDGGIFLNPHVACKGDMDWRREAEAMLPGRSAAMPGGGGRPR